MSPKHVNLDPCPSCNLKREQLCDELKPWVDHIRHSHVDAHVSWTFRDEASQNEAFMNGRSKLKWPNSPHNHKNMNDKPESRAFDLFQLSPEGKALWPLEFFEEIAMELKAIPAPLKWGGAFTKFDYDHFELVVEKAITP